MSYTRRVSHSPHRYRGDPAECWRSVLFGEILRAIDRPAVIAPQETIRLPRSGRWESGLGRITPALDDALGATAFAVAWRWACAEKEANAWPGLPEIARHALEAPCSVGAVAGLAVIAGSAPITITAAKAERNWLLGDIAVIGVSRVDAADWSEVDRIADILSAWFDVPWSIA